MLIFALITLIPQPTPTNLSSEAGDPSAIQIIAIKADRHQQRNRLFDHTDLVRGSRSTAYHTCWKEREVKVSEEYPVIVPGKARPAHFGFSDKGLWNAGYDYGGSWPSSRSDFKSVA